MGTRRDNNLWCKKVDCGRVIKYKLYSHYSHGPQITYLPKDGKVINQNGEELTLEDGCRWYLDKYDEIRQTKPASRVKGENIDSLKRSFARLRDLINANATAPERVLFITCTYDPKRLKSELTLKKVSKDMRNTFYKMRNDGYRFEYIYTVEQQNNGNWHTHVLMFFNDKAPYLEQTYLECVWKHGYIKVSKRFDDSDVQNIGVYVIADLTYGAGSEHGRIKNDRLLSYPSNAHLYRCSKGIKRPIESDLEFDVYLEERTYYKTVLYESKKVVCNPVDRRQQRYYQYVHVLND